MNKVQLDISASLCKLAPGAAARSSGAIAMLIPERGSTAATIAFRMGAAPLCVIIVNDLDGIILYRRYFRSCDDRCGRQEPWS